MVKMKNRSELQLSFQEELLKSDRLKQTYKFNLKG